MTGAHGASDLGDPPVFFGGLVALYTVASRASRPTSATAAVVTGLAILVASLAGGDSRFVDYALNYAVFSTAWVLGDSMRVRRAYTAELEDRAARLERQRAEEARRAAADERSRLARELHDVVAHHLSVIALQSDAAEVLLSGQKDAAGASVAAIGTAARQAMAEMRRLLDALRDDEPGPSDRAPQPALDQLPALVESVRGAGVPVEVTVEGHARPLPDGVELSAYRVVQEALTNVLRHAGPATAQVTVRYGVGDLVVRVPWPRRAEWAFAWCWPTTSRWCGPA